MKSLAAMVMITGASAFSSAPAFVLPSTVSRGAESLKTSALRGASAASNAEGFSQTGSSMTGAAFAAALVALVATRRHGQRAARKEVCTARKAEAEQIVMGHWDPETKTRNYVNPWEKRIQQEIDGVVPEGAKSRWDDRRFVDYKGPVYKKVPVVPGIQFPLDPELYYQPLEPPEPGVKWGDGRAPDGNWYVKEADGTDRQYWQGMGKQKAGCAIVRIFKGTGQFLVNGEDAVQYFEHYPIWWLKAAEPICALSQKNEFDIIAKCFGGGAGGQAGAIRLGLARALQEYNYNWRPLLRRSKYLTRDPRVTEPKKPGRPKARKRTPWHKR